MSRELWVARARDADGVRDSLRREGYAVAEADDDGCPVSARRVQARIATALRLPGSAGRNLDAMLDALRDLGTWWPDDERVALLVHGADGLAEADTAAWNNLRQVLATAAEELSRGHDRGRRDLRVVVLTDVDAPPAREQEEGT